MSTGKRATGGLEALQREWREQARKDRQANAEMNARLQHGETITITTVTGPYVDEREKCADALAPHIAAEKEREEKLAELIVCVQGLLAWKDQPVVGRYDTIGPFGYIRDTDGSRKQIKLVEAALAAILEVKGGSTQPPAPQSGSEEKENL